MTSKRLMELTRKAESGVKMNIPQAYDMLELIDELNHVRGIEFAYRCSVERIYDTAKETLETLAGVTSAADSRAAECKNTF